jgi:uncharacterized protein YjbI with pentapeptide repeats
MQPQRQEQQPNRLQNWAQRLKLLLTKYLNKIHSWWHARGAPEQLLALVFAGLLVVGCALSLLGAAFSGDWSGLLSNLGTGFVGSAVTLFFIDILIGSREKQEAKEQQEAQLKADLVAQFGSSVRNIAIAASEELRRRGWLYDGLLQGEYLLEADLAGSVLSKADLRRANLGDANLQNAELVLANLQSARLDGSNLQRANLLAANLQRASLVSAKLREANLQEANLQEAELIAAELQNARLKGANLQKAYLNGANLEGAELRGANLHGAYLRSTNLHGADLHGATLEEANLNEANFDENTILPDGSKWTPGTDLAAFTSKRR